MIDIDHFKQINDTHGHVAGDTVLVKLSNMLKQIVRQNDYICRFGGEEFVILCRELTVAKCASFAERIRSTVQSLSIKFESQQLNITVSIGITKYPNKNINTFTDIIKQADIAMYQSKKMGRNRIYSYGSE